MLPLIFSQPNPTEGRPRAGLSLPLEEGEKAERLRHGLDNGPLAGPPIGKGFD